MIDSYWRGGAHRFSGSEKPLHYSRKQRFVIIIENGGIDPNSILSRRVNSFLLFENCFWTLQSVLHWLLQFQLQLYSAKGGLWSLDSDQPPVVVGSEGSASFVIDSYWRGGAEIQRFEETLLLPNWKVVIYWEGYSWNSIPIGRPNQFFVSELPVGKLWRNRCLCRDQRSSSRKWRFPHGDRHGRQTPVLSLTRSPHRAPTSPHWHPHPLRFRETALASSPPPRGAG